MKNSWFRKMAAVTLAAALTVTAFAVPVMAEEAADGYSVQITWPDMMGDQDGTLTLNEADSTWEIHFENPFGSQALSGVYHEDGSMEITDDGGMGAFLPADEICKAGSEAIMEYLGLASTEEVSEEVLPGNIGVVETQSGPVEGIQGSLHKNVSLFKGVPFAAPPVGELRWKEPVDPEPWTEVRVCDEEGDAPLMPDYVNALFTDPSTPWIEFYPDGAPSMSEDCLYLNIATPAQSSDEALPVVIWFHGGGFQNGFYYEAEFDPEELANKGCIVVSVGHRLGIFGFLSLPQLSEESEYGASGNYGIMDCIKGVQWVIDNIPNFGGDPEHITLMGQSGGNAKVTACLVSNQLRGKIFGTINQSALAPFQTYTSLEDAEAKGQEYLTMLGVDPDMSVEELRALDADLVNSMSAAGSYSVVLDGKYFSESPVDFYLREGQLDGLHMMFGSVFGESAKGVQIPGRDQPTTPGTAEEFYAYVRETFGDELCDKYDFENNYVVTDGTVNAKFVEFTSHAALVSNKAFAVIRANQNEGGSAYLYSFGRVTPGAEIGWHSGELWYMFGSMRRETAGFRNWQMWDRATADVATDYWSNFIKTGDPNGPTVPYWPAAETLNAMYIDWNPVVLDGSSMLDQFLMDAFLENGSALGAVSGMTEDVDPEIVELVKSVIEK